MSRRSYLVAYDIRDPLRLRDVHKTMKGFGDPMQYSVFLCDLDPMERVGLIRALRDVINERADSVAVVDLGEAGTAADDRFLFLGVRRPRPPSGARIV